MDNIIQNKKASTLPNIWFHRRFQEVFKKHRDAVDLQSNKDGVLHVHLLNEDFLAETLGHVGNPESPIVYFTTEDRFYRYNSESGIFITIGESEILANLSALIQQCANECEDAEICDVKSLRFTLSKTGQLRGVITKAKGLLKVSETYFDSSKEEFIACKNGMLRLADMTLLPFDAKYRCRNKLSVKYDPSATCPMFLDTLMRQSLDDDDINFLQQWFGLALLGKNKSQAIVILAGTAGSGKSTFVDVVTEIIGKDNVHTLRTERLGDKFETSFYLGKTLLHGVDVASDFLTNKNASVLKALTGGDAMNVELKNCRDGGPEIKGNFNVIIICNMLPNIRLEGDVGAWKRRLVLVEYRKPKPQTVIISLGDLIVKDEGPGVFNWALDGLKRLQDNNWIFKLTTSQNDLVDKVLLQSDSARQFVRRCLVEENDASLVLDDCHASYLTFCKSLNWYPMTSKKVNPIIEDEIMRQFGLNIRHDIPSRNGTAQRGWKGVKVK